MSERKIPKTITDVYIGDNKIGASHDYNKMYLELEDLPDRININLVFGDGELIATLMYLDMKTGVFIREIIPEKLKHVISTDSTGKMRVA